MTLYDASRARRVAVSEALDPSDRYARQTERFRG